MTIILTHTAKPPRKEAFSLACKARTHHLTDREIDSLINYFAPSVPTTPKTAFQWVARAVAFNDVRKYLQYVFVADGVMVATDGHRLHHAATDLKNGFYDPKTGMLVEVDAKYPEWRRIIPKRAAMKAHTDSEEWNAILVPKTSIFAAKIGGVHINKKYLDDALAVPNDVFEGLGVVAGDCCFGSFVIQGLRV